MRLKPLKYAVPYTRRGYLLSKRIRMFNCVPLSFEEVLIEVACIRQFFEFLNSNSIGVI